MRFMHIADVHLGASPDHGYLWAKDRGREIWESFRHCIREANEKKIDLLLIAGDLFHRQPRFSELKEVNYLFSTLEHTVVVLIAGNHDCLRPSSPYWNFPWNDNVFCLFSSSCEKLRFPELKTEVYGLSYHTQEIREPLYDTLRADKNDCFRILLAHGGDASHIPVRKEQLAAAGFDYIAMGHIHKPQVVVRNLAMYSGALEPIDCNDFGVHGYIIGETNRHKVHLSFVPAARREYRRCEVAVQPEDTSWSVREKVASAIRESGVQHMYRVILTGQRHPGMRPDIREYMKCGRVLDVTDETAPAFDLEELHRQYEGQLIGDFIESFGEEPLEEIQRKALHYGLEALLYSGGRE